MNKMEQLNKKGQVGMNTAYAFILALITVAVLSFVGIIIFGNLQQTNAITTRTTFNNGSIVNETITLSNVGNATSVATPNTNFTGLSLRAILMTNSSSGTVLTTGNYSQALGVFTATTGIFPNRTVNVSFAYSYTLPSIATTSSTEVLSNGTVGIATFWSSATTWFALLGIVIIILIVTIVIAVIARFNGGSSTV